MEIIRQLDPDRWSEFVWQHPKGSIFHTPEMVEVFNRSKHHQANMLAAVGAGGQILALLVSVRVQTMPAPFGDLSSRAIFYAEPLCRADAEGVEALASLLAEHDTGMQTRALFSEVRPNSKAGLEREALEQCKYEYEEYLNYVIDLRKSPDQLWHGMTNTCRANIHRGQRHGLRIVEESSEAGIDRLYRCLQTTYNHAHVPLADKSLFLNALRILHPKGMLKVFVACCGDRPVGASALLLFKQTAYEWYWGAARLKSVYPAENVTWNRIEWSQQQGYQRYDFGGAGWPGKPYGVRDFKAKFGGELVNYGRYRKVYSRWRFLLAEGAYSVGRKLISPGNWWLRVRPDTDTAGRITATQNLPSS
jgi:CelD/BcsL family acetyltransferase involved in cellulose biosynthesis